MWRRCLASSRVRRGEPPYGVSILREPVRHPTPYNLTMYCVRHPKVETLVRCGKCDRPICTDCMVVGPAGVRCRDCASLRTSPLYQVPADRLLLGVSAGLLVSTACGWLLAAAGGFGFFLFWIGLAYGAAVAETVLRMMRRKRGPKVEAAAGLCTVGGAAIGLILYLLTTIPPFSGQLIVGYLQVHPFFLVGAGVAAFAAVSRTRFI